MNPDTPNTQELCGTFDDLTDEQSDQGRSFPAPIRQSCAKPEVTIAGEASVSYVDGEPVFTAI